MLGVITMLSSLISGMALAGIKVSGCGNGLALPARATAYIVLCFNSLMDYVQLLFFFFNAPVFATFLLGLFTRWATHSEGSDGNDRFKKAP